MDKEALIEAIRAYGMKMHGAGQAHANYLKSDNGIAKQAYRSENLVWLELADEDIEGILDMLDN